MVPAFSPRERVLVNRAAYWFGSPKTNDVVVMRDPREPARLLIKRIDRPAGEGAWLVLGDNATASADSRTFGPVPRGLLVGKVVARY